MRIESKDGNKENIPTTVASTSTATYNSIAKK